MLNSAPGSPSLARLDSSDGPGAALLVHAFGSGFLIEARVQVRVQQLAQYEPNQTLRGEHRCWRTKVEVGIASSLSCLVRMKKRFSGPAAPLSAARLQLNFSLAKAETRTDPRLQSSTNRTRPQSPLFLFWGLNCPLWSIVSSAASLSCTVQSWKSKLQAPDGTHFDPTARR